MPTLEIISPTDTADVLMLDSADRLLEGLAAIVRRGMTDQFNDMQWMMYFGVMEKLEVDSDPAFQAMLRLLGSPSARKPGEPNLSYANVVPRYNTSVRVMSQQEGRGGAFCRISNLQEVRHVVAPAQAVAQAKDRPLIDLRHAISFDGMSMALAMYKKGIDPEIIDYRPEPSFPAYRERAVGQFLLDAATGA